MYRGYLRSCGELEEFKVKPRFKLGLETILRIYDVINLIVLHREMSTRSIQSARFNGENLDFVYSGGADYCFHETKDISEEMKHVNPPI
jgi:hypothetical protein